VALSNVTGKTEKTTQNGKLKKKDVGCDEKTTFMHMKNIT